MTPAQWAQHGVGALPRAASHRVRASCRGACSAVGVAMVDRAASLLQLMLGGSGLGHAASQGGGRGVPGDGLAGGPGFGCGGSLGRSVGAPRRTGLGDITQAQKWKLDTKEENELQVSRTRKPRVDEIHGVRGSRELLRTCGAVKSSGWDIPAVRVARMQPEVLVSTVRHGRAAGGGIRETNGHGRAGDGHVKGRGKGAMSAALEVASDRSRLVQAVADLNKDFWAASTTAARATRRAEVLELAERVANGRPVFPLRQEVVEGVAAALKAAGLTSGFLYLSELKLAHVERGGAVDPWLTRLMGLCKKSLTRKRGPVKRAPELSLQKVEFSDELDESLAVRLGAWAYAWGLAWMLREVELSKVQWKHVTADSLRKTVRLFLPHSKMDQQGLGVSRTLQCCGETPCWIGCAWWLWSQLNNFNRGRRAGDPPWMFPNRQGKQATKLEMVSSWKLATGSHVTGHSARRSGAMAYVRKGMSIQELAYLGRWRSSVGLTYAEEALQTVPANARLKQNLEDNVSTGQGVPGRIVTQCPGNEAASSDSWTCCRTSSTSRTKPTSQRAERLWVKAISGGRAQPLHLVSNASWQMAIGEWSTACGWNFAKRSANVMLVTNPSLSSTKCKKCLEVDKLRDCVKEGVRPARLLAKQLCAKLDTPVAATQKANSL
eukprot:Skav211928  [mRNA]  locus=scaffold1086:172527:174512:+ [translate_table: standard]